MKKKICYVLPEYDRETPAHFAHLYDFLDNIGATLDIFLIVEKGRLSVDLGSQKIYIQKFKFFPLRILENILILSVARLRGYRDFYIHYSFLSAFNGSLMTKFFGGRVFYWNCGLPWKYKRSFLRNTFERSVYRLIAFLVTGTESLRAEYAKYYKIPLNKIKVMPNWINLQKLKIKNERLKAGETKKELNIDENQKVILFVHRLSKRKGAHYLPEILKELKDESIVLIIIGGGPEEKNLKFKIQNSKLSDFVRFLGWVPNEEIYKYYGIADVFIMPSEEEGFPRVLLEAMAMEAPFVAFDVGGVKEIVPPGFLDFVIAAGDIKSFTLKIKEILGYSRDKIEKLRKIEEEWVRNFDLPIVIDKFINLFL